ncbi:efflux RND transporter periplasmic adaptor subunit [Notoacmeibacter ruber]|uniref:Efflux RND transporter periplasmic adaptor subunit n=2 Tax=Notoacmeibacter ruber TaxID=2670375 RepID=A0A3L7JFM2_9HYPH|nr:efflux RND transporter periplasmic adaptor subunit [Notoacmeibacter ruber]
MACLLVVVVASAIWLRLDPNAGSVLNDTGLSALTFLTPETEQEGAAGGPRGGGRRMGGFGAAPLVTVAEVGEASMDKRFSTIGTGLSLRSVTLRPNEAGQVESIEVETGDKVQAGDLIIQLQDDAEVLAVERAQLAVDQAREKVERYGRLSNRGTISSVETDQARTDLATAEVELKEAKFHLSQRRVEAPIDGVAGIVEIDPGEMLTTSSDIVRIEDFSSLQVTFYVPERLAASMVVGKAFEAQTDAVPDRSFEGEIVGVDNRLEEASRTLRVRGKIPNEEGLLRPGMSFRIGFELKGNPRLSVPPLAVQWSTDGAYVWTLDDDRKVGRAPISIVQRNAEQVLVASDSLSVGTLVVQEGVESVREGGGVRIDEAGAGGSTASIEPTQTERND